MKEEYEIVDLGFSVADAEDITFNFDGSDLVLCFIDWQENRVSVKFENTLGYKYQVAEYFNSEVERYDSCYIVHNSEWLQHHVVQNETWENESWSHYKLNFNAGGIIEILCSEVVKA